MVIPRRVVIAAAAAFCLVAGRPRDASAHPLHTTLAQIQYDAARGTLTVSLRVFTDDFGVAVARHAGVRLPVGESPKVAAMYKYVTSRFTLTDAAGKTMLLESCGVRNAGEMLFVCMRAKVAGPPARLRLRNTLLVESFDDQVNIVQYLSGTTRRTTLFTPGDGPKQLS